MRAGEPGESEAVAGAGGLLELELSAMNLSELPEPTLTAALVTIPRVCLNHARFELLLLLLLLPSRLLPLPCPLLMLMLMLTILQPDS